MKIKECPHKCKCTQQDEMYGKGRRVFTEPAGKDEESKCTVCGKEEGEKK